MSEQGLDVDRLVAAAVAARAKAYAPYSRFRVGAAVLLKDGSLATGVNVENASYGLTVCAERHAVACAVLEGAKPGDVEAVAIAADAEQSVAPCGACRQVLAEFAPLAARVIIHNERDGRTDTMILGDLLPHAFSKDSMPRQ